MTPYFFNVDLYHAAGLRFPPSRIDRQVARIIDAAVRLGYLEPVSTPPRSAIYYRLFRHELQTVCEALGITSETVKHRAEAAITLAINAPALQRTHTADAHAQVYFAVGEHVATDRPDDTDNLQPLVGVTITDDQLNAIAKSYESVLLMDSERLHGLDNELATRRMARCIVLIAGGKLTTHVIDAQFCTRNDFLDNRVISQGAIACAGATLLHRLRIDPHHTTAVERFWQQSRTVLTVLGATVTMDVTATFAPNVEDSASERPLATTPDVQHTADSETPF